MTVNTALMLTGPQVKEAHLSQTRPSLKEQQQQQKKKRSKKRKKGENSTPLKCHQAGHSTHCMSWIFDSQEKCVSVMICVRQSSQPAEEDTILYFPTLDAGPYVVCSSSATLERPG